MLAEGFTKMEVLLLGVHFGTAGITVEMDDAVSFQEQVKMVGEFRTVVGLVFVGVSESEFCFFVYGGHNVALNVVGESGDAVNV